MNDFRTVLVANRGEIAVRVIRAARDVGLASVAVYADPDRTAPHVRLADEAHPLHGTTPDESYLDMDRLLGAARSAGADALHPGYGFLSENADFAQAVLDAGLAWIGPSPQTIRDLGDKVTARRIARETGAPLAPGTDAPVDSAGEVVEFARRHGLPVAIKAAFGGGGRGLKVVHDMAEIPELFASATREALAAFGRSECYVERYLDRPRHVEAQVLADRHQNVIVVGTRDCSLQRRHQKLVEEAPAPYLSEEQRELIYSSAKEICRRAGYLGAGTVEYLVGADGTISFLEVNTRLQVEHPVSEETSGIDLVVEQFRIARGEKLRYDADPVPHGHSFEFRINGEDPGRNFLPIPGTVTRIELPQGPGVRVDSGIEVGSVLGGQFDSLLAKLVVTAEDRASALARSRRALDELVVEGVTTVLPFHRAVVRDPAFTAEDGIKVHTRWIETGFDNRIPAADSDPLDDGRVTVLIGGCALRVALPGLRTLGATGERIAKESAGLTLGARAAVVSGDAVAAPMQGTVTRVAVREGDRVARGDLVAVVEAMKMENPVTSHKDGVVTRLSVEVGDTRAQGEVLCEIRDDHAVCAPESAAC